VATSEDYGMNARANPYAPPQATVADLNVVGSEAEAIRQEHIKHEASIRSVGVLYYLGGGFMLLGALALIGLLGTSQDTPFLYGMGLAYLALGGLSIALGRGIRAYRPWARTTGIVLAAIGLLGFPIGTLINGYILYLFLAQKGKRIFEPDYPDIVAATPHIKYRTSLVLWVVLGLLLLAMAALIASAVVSG
jgi:hypothetical protein